VHVPLLLWSPAEFCVLELAGKGNINCCSYCADCFLSQFSGIWVAVWDNSVLALLHNHGDSLVTIECRRIHGEQPSVVQKVLV